MVAKRKTIIAYCLYSRPMHTIDREGKRLMHITDHITSSNVLKYYFLPKTINSFFVQIHVLSSICLLHTFSPGNLYSFFRIIGYNDLNCPCAFSVEAQSWLAIHTMIVLGF